MTNTTTLATKLSDLELFQDVLIKIEQKLMSATADETIRERLEKMLDQDRENQKNIQTAVQKLGSSSAPSRDITQKHADKVEEMMSSDELTLYDKFFQLELLKHQQTMTGLVLHKAAQSLDDDLQDAMEPLNKVNFENRAHQEVLKGVLYFVGTREIADKEPDMGLLGSLEQGVAAVKGAVSSATSSH